MTPHVYLSIFLCISCVGCVQNHEHFHMKEDISMFSVDEHQEPCISNSRLALGIFSNHTSTFFLEPDSLNQTQSLPNKVTNQLAPEGHLFLPSEARVTYGLPNICVISVSCKNPSSILHAYQARTLTSILFPCFPSDAY